VVAVEAFGPSCERLSRAAREQAIALDVQHGDAGEVARRLAAQGARFDVVIVNPPRRGLDHEVRKAIAQLAPRHMAYVSCHPPTLTRDLSHLAREGLAAEELAPFDMMPLTEHVETFAWLTQRPAEVPEVLLEHDDFVAVLKAPHEPTTPQGEHAGSLLLRVQCLPGFAGAVPVHRLDVGTSGVVLFARTPERVHAISLALADGEKTYVALAQGILRAQGRIQRPIVEQGRSLEASTRYKRSEVIAGHSLVRVLLETGRKHQIRRHLAAIGHPLVGDARYGDRRTNQHFGMRHGLDRPFLHCVSLVIAYQGQRIAIDAPLAPDLMQVLESMREDDVSRGPKSRQSVVVPAGTHRLIGAR
jgi:23S rRNA (uracil1939-C5)-methyltransferase